jgi:hypothetical protein
MKFAAAIFRQPCTLKNLIQITPDASSVVIPRQGEVVGPATNRRQGIGAFLADLSEDVPTFSLPLLGAEDHVQPANVGAAKPEH